MRSVPLIVALLAVLASGATVAQSYQTHDSYQPPPGLQIRLWVDGYDVLVFRGTEVHLERHGEARPATAAENPVHLNGRVWYPTFVSNATCPCRSAPTTFSDKGLPSNPMLRVPNARGPVNFHHDAARGAWILSFDDKAFAGGEWYSAEIVPGSYYPNPEGTYPNPEGTKPEDRLKVRALADGVVTLALSGREGWLEIPAGSPRLPTTEPVLYFDGEPVAVAWKDAANATCPCISAPFPLPFASANDPGIPKDARGAIYHWDGRGYVKISEQPADGRGIFRLTLDDARHDGAAWYAMEIGRDPYYQPCRTADGSPCPPPPCAYPADSYRWTEEERRKYAETCHAGPTAPAYSCKPLPPESANWTQEQRDRFAREACAPPPCHTTYVGPDGRTYTRDCAAPACPAPPPDFHTWTPDAQRRWHEANCKHDGGCNPPPEWTNWSDADRKRYVVDKCAYPSHCPAPPPYLRDAPEEKRREWMAANCPEGNHADGSDDGPRDGITDAVKDAANALKDNASLREEARKAAENATGQKIVVPGVEALVAVGGIGAVALMAARRRRD